MTKKELVEKVADAFNGVSKEVINHIITEAFNAIKNDVANGNEFKIPGMGRFYVKDVPEKTYFGTHKVPAHKSVHFRTSKGWTVK